MEGTVCINGRHHILAYAEDAFVSGGQVRSMAHVAYQSKEGIVGTKAIRDIHVLFGQILGLQA